MSDSETHRKLEDLASGNNPQSRHRVPSPGPLCCPSFLKGVRHFAVTCDVCDTVQDTIGHTMVIAYRRVLELCCELSVSDVNLVSVTFPTDSRGGE